MLKLFTTRLVKFVFPPACALCQKTLPAGWTQPWCTTCKAEIVPLPSAHCSLCRQPFIGVVSQPHLCSRCVRLAPEFSAVYCVGLYQGALRHAVRQLKFNQHVNLDRSLALFVAGALPADQSYDVIIPVPLHRSALKHRTYNQAALLAKELGRLLACRVEQRLLVKNRSTLPQHNLTAQEREKNLLNVFNLKHRLNGEHVLLVDDVMTTGATAASCAKELLASGACKVSVATVART